MMRRFAILVLAAWGAGCAGPALRLYTLDVPPANEPLVVGGSRPVIEVVRVSLPDALDTRDIVLRDGARLRVSPSGRWASRLSIGATERLVADLAQRQTGFAFTGSSPVPAADGHLTIDITRFDIDTGGHASLRARWTLVPRDDRAAVIRGEAGFSRIAILPDDDAVVALTGSLIDQLAGQIAPAIRVPAVKASSRFGD